MNTELALIANRLEQAQTPEAVFGELAGQSADQLAGLKKVYHQLARVTHPDIYPGVEDRSAAQVAFADLTRWFDRAEQKIRAGVYGAGTDGTTGPGISFSTGKRMYLMEGHFQKEHIFNRYSGYMEAGGGRIPVTFKIARDPQDNDLAQNEARILHIMTGGEAWEKFSAYLPRLIDSFLYEEDGIARQVNVFERQAGWYSLEEVQRAYPGGIDPKDMAWMGRRLLVGLGLAHINGVIHGAVLPRNVWIEPEQHGLMLVNWSCAVYRPAETLERIAALDPEYAGWYPGEVVRREMPVFGTDLDLAARCLIYLLGGDPEKANLPNTTPEKIRAFLKGCTLAGKSARPQDALALKEEFDDLLQRLWGERKFHPFDMRQYRAA